MNKKTAKISLMVLSALLISGLLFISFADTSNVIKSNTKRNGFDILLPDKDICTLTISGDTLWAGGASGLFEIDMDKLTTKKVGDYKFIRAVLANEGDLWIGHDEGLTFVGDTTITYTKKEGLPDNRVNAVILDRDNHIWVGTWGGAAELGGKKIKTFTTKEGLLDDMVNVIMQDNLGDMWFGSYVAPRGGISVMHGGIGVRTKWQYFTTNDSLLHSNINAIIQTNDKSVIAGGGLYTKGGGTRFVFENNKWIKSGTITKKDGLAGEKIRSLFEDSQNRLWVGSEYDGLVMISGNKKIKLTQKTGISNDEVKVIREDNNKNIWIGSRKGLTRISNIEIGGMKNEQ